MSVRRPWARPVALVAAAALGVIALGGPVAGASSGGVVRLTMPGVPAFVVQGEQAAAKAHSYIMRTTTGGTGGPDQLGSVTVTDVVGSGKSYQAYGVTTVNAFGAGVETYSYTSATQSCTRPSTTPKWKCTAISLANLEKQIEPRLSASDVHLLGVKTILGQRAAGASMEIKENTSAMLPASLKSKIPASTPLTITLHSTYWLSVSTHLPVEVLTTEGSGPSPIMTKITYSDWNSPSVRLPAGLP